MRAVRAAMAAALLLGVACGGRGDGAGGGGGAGGGSTGGEQAAAAPERDPLGETTVVARPTGSPMITIRVVFDAGSAEDPSGREGATRLAARLMVEGGAGELSYAQITERLFPMAGAIDAFTGRDQTVIVGRVHRDHLDSFYEIFRSVLTAPSMSQEDFSRVLAQAQSALTLELRGNDDEELGKEALQAMLYEGHPYGHPSLGTEAGLSDMTVEDVRAQRLRVFCGGRAAVGVTGAYPDGFAERVRADVASLASPECLGRIHLPPPPASGSRRVLIVDKAEAGSVAISMGVPVDVLRGDADYPALVLAVAYLGQHRQFAGRLMQKMRGDRGLNYGDYAYPEHFDQDGWSTFPLPNTARRQQYFSIWIRPVQVEHAHFALRMAIRELADFVERGLSAEDFERVRNYVDGYYALYLQTESRQLGFALDDGFYGQERPWLQALREAWHELTVEQVNAAIRRHIDPARLQIAMVAPDGAALAERVASDAPSPIEYESEKPEPVLAEDRQIQGYRLDIERSSIRVLPVAQIFR